MRPLPLPSPRMRRRLVPLLALAAIVLAAAACGGGSTAAEPESAVAPPASPATDATIVDVRTPEEFAAGHVAGAVNVDVQADDFDARIAELPTDGSYVVYCRSGNRSARAVERMRGLGFTDLADGGGLEDMAAAGYELGP